VLPKFEIGRVKDSEFPPYKPDSGFYKALCQRVGKYFKDNKLNPKVRGSPPPPPSLPPGTP
jgi:hypothetical protein